MTTQAGPELDRLVGDLLEPGWRDTHLIARDFNGIPFVSESEPAAYSTDPGIAFTLLLKVCKEREWWYEISSDYIVIDGPQWSPRGPRSRLVCIRHTAEATAICLALVEAVQKVGCAPSEPA